MGKKKPREAAAPDTGIASAPSIFQSLFGEISGASSIFSDKNPFRRKPSEHSHPIPAAGEDGGFDNPSMAESKKRKGEERESAHPDVDAEGSDIASVKKKSKKKKKGVENQADAVEVREAGDVGVESEKGSVIEKGREKKKRKRDEIEKEYEEKHFGAEAVGEGGERKSQGRALGVKRKSANDAAEQLVPREGFDDESKLLRTVFVGNLPLKMKKKALLKEFSQFGEIESVRIRSVPLVDSKTPRIGAIMKKKFNDSVDSVNAYIVFKTEESAQLSLSHNMAVVGGNHVRVDRACPPRKKLKGEVSQLYDNRRTVFLGNLPFDVKDEEIYQLFSSIHQLKSTVEAVRVIRDPHTSIGKGIAYVLFKTREAADSLLRRRYLKLRDRELRLSRAKSDSTPSKRSNPSHSETLHSTPAKKLALDLDTPKDGYERRKAKSDNSYQGLRVSKSGNQEKVRKTFKKVNPKSLSQKEKKPKERSDKRPSVAARKAKQVALSSIGLTKVAGQKRKGSRTPEFSQRNKKAKKF